MCAPALVLAETAKFSPQTHALTSHTKPYTLPAPRTRVQRDLLELLYRCARNGRPELHTRFMGDPELAAAFDELLEKDPGVRADWVFGPHVEAACALVCFACAGIGNGPKPTTRTHTHRTLTWAPSCTASWSCTTRTTTHNRGEGYSPDLRPARFIISAAAYSLSLCLSAHIIVSQQHPGCCR